MSEEMYSMHSTVCACEREIELKMICVLYVAQIKDSTGHAGVYQT